MSKQSKVRSSLEDFQNPLLELNIICCMMIAAVAFAVYANSLHGEIIFDDGPLLDGVRASMPHSITDFFHTLFGWRGLLMLTYQANYALHGMSVFGYHLANAFLHSINCVLLYILLIQFTRPFVALPSSLLFATHTLLTSSVASISGRSSLLCATFYLAALLIVFRPQYRARWTGPLTVLFWGAAMLTKQEAIVLPGVLLASYFLYNKVSRTTLAWVFGAGATGVLFYWSSITDLLHTVASSAALTDAGFDAVLPRTTFFTTYIAALGTYVAPRMLFPLHLGADPYIPTITAANHPAFVVTLIAVFALGFLMVYLRHERLLSFGLLLLLCSPLLPYAFTPMADIIMENRLYIPMLAIPFLTATILDLIDRVPTMTYAVILVFFLLTVQRNRIWRDPMTFWESAVQSSPQKARPHHNLANQIQQRGPHWWPDAIKEYVAAIAMKPNLYAAYMNVAALQIEMGDYPDAESNLITVTTYAPKMATGWTNLGALALRRGDPQTALLHFNHALELDPSERFAQINRQAALKEIRRHTK